MTPTLHMPNRLRELMVREVYGACPKISRYGLAPAQPPRIFTLDSNDRSYYGCRDREPYQESIHRYSGYPDRRFTRYIKLSDGITVVKDGSSYKMWFRDQQNPARRTLCSTSKDGVTWEALTPEKEV